MIVHLYFFHNYGTMVVHIGQGWLLSNNFCKTCLSFVIIPNAVRIHTLLPCCESSRKCTIQGETTTGWTKTI